MGVTNSTFDGTDSYGNYGGNLIEVDGNGNAWITNSANYTLSKVSPDALTVSGYSNPIMARNYNSNMDMAIDPSGNIYVANTDASNSSYTKVNNTGAVISGSPVYSNVTGGFSSIALDATGNIWVSKQASNAVFEYTTLGYPSPGILYTDGSATDNAGPVSLTFDGLGRLWGPTYEGAGITELSNSGVRLSPTMGYGYVTPPYGYTGQPLTSYNIYNNQNSFALDSSGNAWASGNQAQDPPYFYTTLYEFVGLAAPVITPLSYAVKTASLAVRP